MIHFLPSRPVVLELFGFSIHWYGLLYVLSFVIALTLLPRLQRLRGLDLSRDTWLDIVAWSVAGVLVGGRLGFVLLYEPRYFLEHPLHVFAVWEGGMASHGGFIGVSLVILYISWKNSMNVWQLADIATVPGAIGLGLGRIGNFINQELYGTVTTLPWGVVFPDAIGPRHPIQIYDFFLMSCIAGICLLMLRKGIPAQRGRIFAIFLMLYGIIRFCLEYVRAQDYPFTVIGPIVLTRGQLFTLPLFFFGVLLWFLLPLYAGDREASA